MSQPTPAILTVRRLYRALAALDGAAMQACYAPGAQFEDEVFSLCGADQVGGMWRMLCDAARSQGRDDWWLDVGDIVQRGPQIVADWQAHYRFAATGRLVRNQVHARIDCDAQGLILRHHDRFSFWRWSRQALGAPGLLLGWTPLLHRQVRGRAQRQLDRYLAPPPGPATSVSDTCTATQATPATQAPPVTVPPPG